ncbi:MAG: Rrf2 family transcriptional regulator [Acidobacteria bacterium]|nr:Rrf2 family transcriptional regulator [Acidobacteriota bacterium]
MKLSAQEEYGLRCLLHMARIEPGESLSIPEISGAEGLSIPNVAKLMRLLRIGGFVTSARGQAGGYTLARPAERITVGEVLELLGGNIFGPAFCQRHSGVLENCVHREDCSVGCLWNTVQHMIENLLTATTLKDLLKSQEEMQKWLDSFNGNYLPAAVAAETTSGVAAGSL